MVKTLSLYRKAEVKSNLGEINYDYTFLANFEGIIDQLRADEVLANDKLQTQSSHVLLTFDVLLDIKEQDQVRFGNKSYRVQSVDNPMSMNAHLEVILWYEGVVEDVV